MRLYEDWNSRINDLKILELKNHGYRNHHHQEDDIPQGKSDQVFHLGLRIALGNLFVGNQAGHRCDQGTETADIRSDDQFFPFGSKTGEQQCSRNITDDLADADGYDALVSFQNMNDEILMNYLIVLLQIDILQLKY